MALNFFFIIVLIIDLLSPITVDSQTFSINVWPKPTNVSWALPAAAPLSSSFKIYSPRHLHLRSAVARYSRLILSERYRPILPPALNLSASPSVRSLFISVSDLSVPLQHGIDESYTLSIAHSVAKISSSTPWGAMRGLESFSQLVWGDPPVVAVGIYITDRPIFAHRGVMLDTARNFYPVRDILRTISAMSANKLNVFHWHITDSQSFPIGLPSEPQLAAKGSHGDGMVYSPSDVKAIVEFGMNHGVRVLPEIDAPGHTGSWAGAYPAIVACANKFWLPPGTDWADRLASEPGTGQLNPLNPQTYQVVHNVHRNLATLFPEFLLHAGGDEIIPGCWKSDPTIQSFLSNGGTLSQLLATFVNETHPYILSLNRTAVYWEDVLLDDVINVAGQSVLETSTTILQTWNKGPNNTRRIVGMGYRVIVSSSDFYYLDCGHGDFVGNDSSYDGDGSDMGTDGGSWCGPYKTWQRVYDYDIAYGLSEREAELVMGGEVALWSEQADGVVVDGRLWPRAAAMAEALWSGNRGRDGRKRYADATDRLIDWRDRMVGRGIRAEPLQPLWCRMHPGMCNLVQ